jgi:hypothetical protein
MRVRASVGRTLAAAVLVGVLFPAVGAAGRLSRPVLLPAGHGSWSFAVNDRGEAVAAREAANGVSVYQVGASGRLLRSWLVPSPPHVPQLSVSIALGPTGEVALGMIYNDGQEEPSSEYHEENEGCCTHVAVASWRLGSPPPPVQIVSGPDTDFYLQPTQLLLAVGVSTVTALWVRGDDPVAEHSQRGEAQIEAAYGVASGSLTTQRITGVLHGVEAIDLHEDPAGPTASWLYDQNRIATDGGGSNGRSRPAPPC